VKRSRVILPPATPAVLRGLRLAVARLNTHDPVDLGLGAHRAGGVVLTASEERHWADFLAAVNWLEQVPAVPAKGRNR